MRKPMPRRISNGELDAALTAIHRHLEFTDLPASRDQLHQEIQSITAHIEGKRERERAKEEEVKRMMEQFRRELLAHRPSARRPRYKSHLAARRLFWPGPGYRPAQMPLRGLELLAFLHRVGRDMNSSHYPAECGWPPRTQDLDDPAVERENSRMRRMAAVTIFMYTGLIFWILLATAFRSVLSPGAAGAVAGGMTLIIGLAVKAAIASFRNVRPTWGAREPRGPVVEIWKAQD